MSKLFEGAVKDWKFVLAFAAFSMIFLLIELSYQLYIANMPLEFAIVRGFAFSGATFIALSLFSSIVFKFYPKYAKYWNVRRSLGVAGFLFGIFHVMAVYNFYFGWDVAKALTPFNPIENPRVFGFIAYIILLALFLTSTDWAEAKLRPPRWKMIHRLVYFGFWALVAHFMLVNPEAIMDLPGYLLIFITLLTLAGQLYWFVKISARNKFSNLGTKIGFLIIFLYLVLAYLLYLKYFA